LGLLGVGVKITIELNSIDELKKLKDWLNRVDTREETLISDLRLTVRAEKILNSEGIFTVHKLCEYSEIDVLRIPNMSKKMLREITDVLHMRGFKLRGEA
jgi:DNA-directed RNA polymerase alpha subunit